jgi:hypothetical protein
MARHLAQPLARDSFCRAMSRSVVEHRRWLDRLQLEIDGNTMSLVRADQGARRIEREAAFVVPCDDLVQLNPAEWNVMTRARGQDLGDGDPAARPERQSKSLRLVSQMLAQLFADLDQPRVIHCRARETAQVEHTINNAAWPSRGRADVLTCAHALSRALGHRRLRAVPARLLSRPASHEPAVRAGRGAVVVAPGRASSTC